MAVFWLARRWGPAIFLGVGSGGWFDARRLMQLEHWFAR